MVSHRAARKIESFLKNTKIFFFKSKAKSKAIRNENEEKERLKTAVTKLITTNWMEFQNMSSVALPLQ